MAHPISVQSGQIIGSYRIVKLLGSGAMGAVYEAVHEHIDRRAAIKFLSLDTTKYPDLTRRFFNEARAANQIKHPGVVQVYEFGQLSDGTPWMLMEYIEGETLDDRLTAARKSPAGRMGLPGLPIAYQLASILSATHARGIVHRDLKPGNVMLVADPVAATGERVKLLDFGIAKLVTGSLRGEVGGANPPPLTATGAMLGTPAYMAPEQCRDSGEVDGQADVYALGAILYQMLAGRIPFSGDTPWAIIAAKVYDVPPALTDLDPSLAARPELTSLVNSMLEKEPGRRPTMPQVEVDLRRLMGLDALRQSGPLAPLILNSGSALAIPASDTASSLGHTVDHPAGGMAPVPGQQAPSAVPQLLLASEATAPLRGTSKAATGPVAPIQTSAPLVGSLNGLTPRSKTKLIPWVLVPVMLVGVSITVAMLQRPGGQQHVDGAKTPAPSDLSSSSEARPLEYTPPPVPRDMNAPIDLAMWTTPGHTGPSTAAKVPARRCTPTSVSTDWIYGSTLTAPQRLLVRDALLDAGVKLCPGEQIVIAISPTQVRVKSAPSSMSHETQRIFSLSLRGRLQDAMPKSEIEVRCKAR